jgi:hypothetical protein
VLFLEKKIPSYAAIKEERNIRPFINREGTALARALTPNHPSNHRCTSSSPAEDGSWLLMSCGAQVVPATCDGGKIGFTHGKFMASPPVSAEQGEGHRESGLLEA